MIRNSIKMKSGARYWFILLNILVATEVSGQDKINADIIKRQSFPYDLKQFIEVKITDVKDISESKIVSFLPNNYFFLDSASQKVVKCNELVEFKMSLYRKGEKSILDIPSDSNKLSFNMRIILKQVVMDDIIQIDYVSCLNEDKQLKRYQGVFLKIIE